MTTERSSSPSMFRRVTGRVAIALVVVGTTIGIVGLLRGRLDDNAINWMITSFVGAFYLGIGQASAAAWDARRLPIGLVGQVLSVVGFLNYLWGAWGGGAEFVIFWKLLGITFFVSLACAQSSLLLLMRADGPLKALRVVSLVSGWFVAAAVTLMIVAEFAHPELVRWCAVAFMLATSSSAVCAILHRLTANDPEA